MTKNKKKKFYHRKKKAAQDIPLQDKPVDNTNDMPYNNKLVDHTIRFFFKEKKKVKKCS